MKSAITKNGNEFIDTENILRVTRWESMGGISDKKQRN